MPSSGRSFGQGTWGLQQKLSASELFRRLSQPARRLLGAQGAYRSAVRSTERTANALGHPPPVGGAAGGRAFARLLEPCSSVPVSHPQARLCQFPADGMLDHCDHHRVSAGKPSHRSIWCVCHGNGVGTASPVPAHLWWHERSWSHFMRLFQLDSRPRGALPTWGRWHAAIWMH